jgi:hypothetical protein
MCRDGKEPGVKSQGLRGGAIRAEFYPLLPGHRSLNLLSSISIASPQDSSALFTGSPARRFRSLY